MQRSTDRSGLIRRYHRPSGSRAETNRAHPDGRFFLFVNRAKLSSPFNKSAQVFGEPSTKVSPEQQQILGEIMENCCCGFMTVQKIPVPLKSIDVELEVRDHVATVVSTLNYENKEDKPIEAVFVFPLPGDAAVCHFSAKMGQKEIVAEVKEKKEAREEYDDALASGQQAFLLEESDQSPDIFSMSVGSLPPGESASIRLEYVTELAVQADEGLRFCLPAVLNPRYTPEGSEGPTVQLASVPASLVPYSLSFSARVSSPRVISKVESNCSLDPLQYLNSDQTQVTVKLGAEHKFDRDVEVLIYYKDAHQPTAVVEAGQASAQPGTLMGDPVVMVSLFPEFPQSIMSSHATCGEFVFLVDRSGSMGASMNQKARNQTRMSSARDTLLLLLKSLPMGCYFNIYSFGSSYEHIFPKSVEYSQETMVEALKKVGMMEANLGGTEILRPLQHIFDQPCIPSQPRQLFVFTDGEVGNTKAVIDLVKKNSNSHRCFSFGIGEGASSALINGLAVEGRGHAQFITGTDRMQPKVMQSLQFALQPAVVDISITWDLPKDVCVTVLSPPITALFKNQRSLVYGQLTGQSSETAKGCVTVKYSLAGHPNQDQLHFSLKPEDDTRLTVHRLGARTRIRSLEMETREHRWDEQAGVKEKVVALSIQSGVSSCFTAFIAVNKGDGEPVQGPLVRRNVPAPAMMMFSMPTFHCNSGSMNQPLGMRHCLLGGLAKSCSPPRQPKSVGRFKSRVSTESCSPPQQPVGRFKSRVSTESCSPPQQRSLSRDVKVAGADAEVTQLPCDPLLRLVSLQSASGFWMQDAALAAALEKTGGDLDKSKPGTVKSEVWATVLALICLHAIHAAAKDEWEILARKAVLWLQAQNVSNLTECVAAGNALLGCCVQKDALGL